MDVLGLHCCPRAFCSTGEGGYFSLQSLGFSWWWLLLLQSTGSRALAQASLVTARGLQSSGSVLEMHGLNCPTACGILPDQLSNLCPLYWQVDS